MSDGRARLEERLSASERAAFARYYRMLVEWNERVNLTAVTDESEVYIKHFWDSLDVLAVPEFLETIGTAGLVADVGSGAGFPGLPLAICRPQTQFVLMDSLQKRVGFLQAVVAELRLSNVQVVHGRAEELARQETWRQRFDVAVSRAVARLNVLAELTVPFVRPGGCVVAYKGPQLATELADGERAARKLGARVERVAESSLPDGYGERSFVVLRVERRVDARYPRRPGTPQKHPL
jgi:16S rRNA (guanine527-N7)-methyltransferase